MSLEYLSEAFKKMRSLNEETFNVTDDGIDALADLKSQDVDEDTVEIIDPDAETEEDLKTSYIGKIILECPTCHSFIFEDRDDVEVDQTSETLVNVTKECPYCCTAGGFNICGQVAEFDPSAEESEEDIEPEESVEEESEAVSEEEVSSEETPAEEETENESLEEAKCICEREDACEGADCDEGCDEQEECNEQEDCDEGLGTAIATAVAGRVIGNALSDKLLKDELQTVENDLENAIADVLNNELGIDSWTSFEYDDEDIVRAEDDEDDDFVGVVTVKNGDEVLGKFTIDDDNKLVSVEEDEKDEDSDDEDKDEKSEEVDESVCPDCGKNPCECEKIDESAFKITKLSGAEEEMTEDAQPEKEFPDGIYDIEGDFAAAIKEIKKAEEKEHTNESLSVETSDDATVVSDGEKVVTIADAEVSEEKVESEVPAEEVAEETTEVVAPISDAEKEEILNQEPSAEEAPAEETPVEEESEEDEMIDVPVEEIEEESFNALGKKFLTKTYENVNDFNTTSATYENDQLILEGVITFKSGRTKNTKFVFEALDVNAEGRVRFSGMNEALSKGKKAFTVSGKVADKKFISESFNYNFNTKDTDGKTTRVYGTIKND